MISSLSLRSRIESAARNNPAVRNVRSPPAATFSTAPEASDNSLMLALEVRPTVALEIETRLSLPGTPAGLQYDAVDQFPPLAGPTQFLPRPESSLRIVPTPCASARVPLRGWLKLTKKVSSDSLRVSPMICTATVWVI